MTRSKARSSRRARQPVEAAQRALPQPARPGPSTSRGRRRATASPVRIHSVKPRGPQAGRHDLPDPGVRRPGRYRQHGRPQTRRCPKTGAQGQRRRERRLLVGRHHPARTSRSSARSACRPRSRRSPRFSRTTTAATWTCRTWRPGARDHLPPGPAGRGAPLCRRLPRHPGRTGNCAAWRSRSRRSPRCRSTLIKNYKIAWPRLENEEFVMTIGSARPLEDAARIRLSRNWSGWFAARTEDGRARRLQCC